MTRQPLSYCMATVEQVSGSLGESDAPLSFIRVSSIGGLNPGVNRKLSAELCTLLARELAIPADRIYINFESLSGSNWGHNGTTF
jgi:hypothetical protein